MSLAALPVLAAIGLGLVLMNQSKATGSDTRNVKFASYLTRLGTALQISVAALGNELQAITKEHSVTGAGLNTTYYQFVGDVGKKSQDPEVVRQAIADYFKQLGQALAQSPALFQAQISALNAAGYSNTVTALMSCYYGALQDLK